MSTAVAEQPPRHMTIRDRLKTPGMIAELGKAMPAHCKPERMARIALTAITKTPKLQNCTEASFFECLLNLSQWGLEPDGRRAHLIPYGDKCTLIIDYKGLVELAYRSGIVKRIHADVVREGDVFEYDRGEVTKHTPWFLRRDDEKPDNAGEVFAVYCLVELSGGTSKCEVLPKLDVEKIRARSRAGSNGPWVTDWEEMAKKTAFRRVSKWLPLSAEIRDAMDGDDDRLPDAVPANPKGPASIDAIGQMLEQSSYEPTESQVQNPEPDVVDEAPKQEGGDPWARFTKEVAAATQAGEVKALRKRYATAFPDKIDEFVRLCDDAEHSIHESRKSGGKKSKDELFEKSPTAQTEGA